MPTIRLAVSGGAVIIANNVAYYLKDHQPTPGEATAVASKTNIPARTWQQDDNNVVPPAGINHKTWTACECAVAGWVPGNQASVVATGALDYLFTAPVQGIARCSHQNISYTYPTNYYVRPLGGGSDILYGSSTAPVGWGGPSLWPSIDSTYAIMLNAGDIVKISSVAGTGQYLWFLPYAY